MPPKITFVLPLLVVSFAPLASAIVIGSGNPSDYLSAQTAVGFAVIPGIGSCSGSLLSTGQHFLTAAHCVVGNTGPSTITFNNGLGGIFSYTSIAMVSHPAFNSSNYTNDLAVIALNNFVDPTINRLDLYSGTGELNSIGTVIGYGRPGTGDEGSLSGQPSIRREGQNKVDSIPTSGPGAGTLLYYDFDNDSQTNNAFVNSDVALPLEVGVAPGDSGGPTLINGQIAGIHSFITCFGLSANVCNTPPDVNGTLNSSYGEIFADTRVSSYVSWINETVTQTSIPEPSTYATGLIGLFLCLAKARPTRNGSPS
jgi:secreted trypsin-like serine protease